MSTRYPLHLLTILLGDGKIKAATRPILLRGYRQLGFKLVHASSRSLVTKRMLGGEV